MYTVTCPSCEHKERSAFARVGAVMVCNGCNKPVQLRTVDIKRQVRLRTNLEDDLFKVALVRHGAPEAPPAEAHVEAVEPAPPPPPVHDPSAELAEHAAAAAAKPRVARPKARAAPPAPAGSSAALAQELARRRSRNTVMIAGGAAVAVLVGVVFLVNALSGTGNGAPQDPTIKDSAGSGTKDGATKDNVVVVPPDKDKSVVPDPDKDKNKDKNKVVIDPPDPPDPPVQPKTVRVTAIPYGDGQWQRVNELYNPPASNAGVVLADPQRVNSPAGDAFEGKVVSRGVVPSAMMMLWLINDEDRVYARLERPVAMLDGKSPRPVRFDIPSDLLPGLSMIDWRFVATDANIKNPRLLQDTLAEVMEPPANEESLLKVSAYNAWEEELHDAVFVLQAMADEVTVLRQWRLKYPENVGPKQWVKFEAVVPFAGAAQVARWRVLAAGIGTGQTPVNANDPRPPDEPIKPLPSGRPGLFDF